MMGPQAAIPCSGWLRLLMVGGIILAVASATGAGNPTAPPGGENIMVSKTFQEVLQEHSRQLMAINGVVGTGQGVCGGKPCIIVFVVKNTPEIKKKIPEILQGYPVMIEETGPIRALPKNRQ